MRLRPATLRHAGAILWVAAIYAAFYCHFFGSILATQSLAARLAALVGLGG